MTETLQELIVRLQEAMHNESAAHSPRTTFAIEAMRAAQTYIEAAAKREAMMQDRAEAAEKQNAALRDALGRLGTFEAHTVEGWGFSHHEITARVAFALAALAQDVVE